MSTIRNCSYSQWGCLYKGEDSMVREHEEDKGCHMNMMMAYCEDQKIVIEMAKCDLQRLQQENQRNNAERDKLKRKKKKWKDEFKRLKAEYECLEKEYKSLLENSTEFVGENVRLNEKIEMLHTESTKRKEENAKLIIAYEQLDDECKKLYDSLCKTTSPSEQFLDTVTSGLASLSSSGSMSGKSMDSACSRSAVKETRDVGVNPHMRGFVWTKKVETAEKFVEVPELSALLPDSKSDELNDKIDTFSKVQEEHDRIVSGQAIQIAAVIDDVKTVNEKVSSVCREGKDKFETLFKLQAELATQLAELFELRDSIKADPVVAVMKEEDTERIYREAFHKKVFIWKVEGFSYLLHDAKTGKQKVVVSDSFDTDDYGYKMRIYMRPNGDSDHEGSHVSLYFQLMQGSWDAILKWPFPYEVTLLLLDQLGKCDDIKMNINMNHGKQDYTRPLFEANTGLGFPDFISHKRLWNSKYLVDDTLYIKVIVHK